MINTELSLFLARSEIELNHVHEKLRLLLLLADEDAAEDCIDSTMKILEDARETATAAAAQIDSVGRDLWLKLYALQQEQKKAAEAEAAKAATTIVVKGKDAAEQAPEKNLKATLDAWDKSREANAAAECKGCGCDSDGLADYGCAGCSCTKASDEEGGKLNG